MALGDAVQPQAFQSKRVVLEAYGFIGGWLIATSLWVGVLLLVIAAFFGVPAVQNGTDVGHVWGFLGIAVLYGFGVALLVAAPLAWVLAYLLRPVQKINGSTLEPSSWCPRSHSGYWAAFWVLAGSP